MSEKLKDTMRSITCELLAVNESEVTDDASFTNDLGADSLDVVELIMEFEKRFNMRISDEDAETLTTFGKAYEFLKERVNSVYLVD